METDERKNGPPQGYMKTKDAIKMAADVGIQVTTATMIVWLEKHNLGFQPGGINSAWYVNVADFKEFLNGKTSPAKP